MDGGTASLRYLSTVKAACDVTASLHMLTNQMILVNLLVNRVLLFVVIQIHLRWFDGRPEKFTNWAGLMAGPKNLQIGIS